MINRIVYFGYYLKELDRNKFQKFVHFVSNKYGISKYKLWIDIIRSSLKYNISILDYFYFKFYKLNDTERNKYAGTGYMYDYQLIMNPKKQRNILENKLLFNKKYSSFISHTYCSKTDFLENSNNYYKSFINNLDKLVLKSSDGQCGEGIEVLNLKGVDLKKIKDILNNTDNDLIEEFIVQHDDLMKLSPAGLNTVRIFTQLGENSQVELLGARLRITIDSYVDNLAAGNIAAPINIVNGLIEGPGVYSDITKQDEELHPITGEKLIGFQIPYWNETLKMVNKAALLYPQNRSIGWDIAITNKGPELLEGNHNWCKLLWQLPVKKGLKDELEKYI